MQRTFISFLFFLCCAGFLNAAPYSAESANRRTAVRCLKLAENYLSGGDYGNALAQAELGLSYDDLIADLWYIKAAAKSGLSEVKAEIIPLVMRAMTEGEWVDYNRDGARILYADLLCDTGSCEQALAILDAKPFVYSSDAEYIRVKACYRMRTAESIQKAREKIDVARKIYPADKRFPHVFFKYEYDLHRGLFDSSFAAASDERSELLVQKIADSFIVRMPEYDNPDADLEIYATYFATGERQKRMAQAFVAHGMKHPLYALIALNCSLMSQQEAWDYFSSFSDKEISLSLLEDFLSLITDEVTVSSVREHLNSFEGVISVDTDFDCDGNLFITYFRGRPRSFWWDENNDGIREWSVDCDFGVPETLSLTQGNVQLFYGTYPAVIKAVFKSERLASDLVTFNLMDETLSWTPVEIRPLELVRELFQFDFFVPFVNSAVPMLNESRILFNCSSYEISSDERPSARIVFSVLNGYPQSATYYSFDSVYAHALFENGFPTIRSVDNDGDGVFELLETFGYDPENLLHRNSAEQEQVMTNLFGLPVAGSGIYLRMVQLDHNGDTIPDFTEEYLADEGKVSSWDIDGDREWDVRYKRYPRANAEEPLVEDSQFYSVPEKHLVTVTTRNGEPASVSVGKETLSVFKGEFDSFYWVGAEGSGSDEVNVMDRINTVAEQGCSILVENDGRRIQAVRIGVVVYAYLIPEPTSGESEQTDVAGNE